MGLKFPPVCMTTIEELLGRDLTPEEQKYAPGVVFYSGSMKPPLEGPRVAVVGTRKPIFRERVTEVVSALVDLGFIIVSGLARGVDTIAHTTAIERGGRTIAVLPTPLTSFYPPENKDLQLKIMWEHLAISRFFPGSRVTSSNFPLRNMLMALISDAAIVTEADSNSGVRALCSECVRLRRPLLLHRTLFWIPWCMEAVSEGAKLYRSPSEAVEFILSSLSYHKRTNR